MAILLTLILFFLAFLALIQHIHASSSWSATSESSVSGDYLYQPMGQEAWPIQEYLLPPSKTTNNNNNNNNNNETDSNEEEAVVLPDFLKDANGGNRLVEFYAPWCPHCRHFKKHYIALGRDLVHATQESSNEQQKIDLYAISCTAHRPICRHFEVHSYPTMVLFPNGQVPNENATHLSVTQVHPFLILKEFGIESEHIGLVEQDEEEMAAAKRLATVFQEKKKRLRHGEKDDATTPTKTQPVRNKEDVFSDALLSFDFSIRQSIYMTNGPLDNRTRDAFYSWIKLLNQALPPQWKLHRPVSAMLDNFQAVATSEKELLKIMDSTLTLDKKKDWTKSCGYTCGLWELLHILTVGALEWNLASESEGLEIAVDKAADALHDYILNFFGCDVCRRHFVAEYDACAHDLCRRLSSHEPSIETWQQLPLWLWEAHNDVNVRLLHEKTERENWQWTRDDEIRVTWPLRDACPMCWRADGSWDEQAILRYLRLQYWPEDALTREFRKDIMEFKLAEASPHKEENDDDNEEYAPIIPLFVPLLGVVGLLVAVGGWYKKKLEVHKTGRHKKFDLIA